MSVGENDISNRRFKIRGIVFGKFIPDKCQGYFAGFEQEPGEKTFRMGIFSDHQRCCKKQQSESQPGRTNLSAETGCGRVK